MTYKAYYTVTGTTLVLEKLFVDELSQFNYNVSGFRANTGTYIFQIGDNVNFAEIQGNFTGNVQVYNTGSPLVDNTRLLFLTSTNFLSVQLFDLSGTLTDINGLFLLEIKLYV